MLSESGIYIYSFGFTTIMAGEIFEYNDERAPISYYVSCGMCGDEFYSDSIVQTRDREDFQGAFDRQVHHSCCVPVVTIYTSYSL